MLIKPKKRFGQNFLIDKNIQKKIIESCELGSLDIVLEIGAGSGEITKLIAERVENVYALEIDFSLCNILKENLKRNTNVKVINQDILKFNFKKYFAESVNKIKVLGNIPFYITSPIIEYLLKFRDEIVSIFITVQKEFGQRVIASSGSKDYGRLSCFVQYYAVPKILFLIKRTCFRPIPKVDACFLQLKIRPEPLLKPKEEKRLFRIIRSAFQQRRKILKNSLKGIITQAKLERFMHEYGRDPNLRPEELTLNDFLNLTKI